MMIDYFVFSLSFHTVFNNLSLFMSMPNLIYIYIHFIDMKRHMLICFFIFMSMLVDSEKRVR